MKTKVPNSGLGRRLSAARRALYVILVAVAILGRPTPAQACGTGTHHEVVDRAIEKLRTENTYPELVRLLDNNLGSVYAGSVFPDWGYGLSSKEDEYKTEVAHLDAFLEGYLGYLLNEDIRPYTRLTDENKRTIAFLFGLVSHHEADAAWHTDNSTQHTHPLLPTSGTRFEDEALRQTTPIKEELAEANAEVWVNIDHGQSWVHLVQGRWWLSGGLEEIFKGKGYKPWTLPGAWEYPSDAVKYAYKTMPLALEMDDNTVSRHMNKLAFTHAGLEHWQPLLEAQMEALFVPSPWWKWIRENLESYELGGLDDCADKTVASWKQYWDRLTGRQEVARVTISGPTKGPRAQYTFTAAFEPADASPPAGWAWDNGDTTMTTTRELTKEGINTLSVTANDRWGNALATASHTMTVRDWEATVRDNKCGSTPTRAVESAIAVVVTGRPGLVVDIQSGGWTATCTTGNKAEYGPNACEFGGLRASTYTITPRGWGESGQVTVDGVGWALLEFAPTIVSASPAPPAASRHWQGWVEGNTSNPTEPKEEEKSVIIVRVAGGPGVQVTMSGGGDGPQTCEAGSRPEYGLYVCRFWGLGAGIYTLQPATSDKQVSVEMDGKGTAFVFFQAP